MAVTVTDVVSRPVRSAAQGSAAWITVELVDSFFFNLDERQYGVLVAALTVVYGWIQVLVENKWGKAFMREPEPPAKPVEVVEESPIPPDLPKDVRNNARPLGRHEKDVNPDS